MFFCPLSRCSLMASRSEAASSPMVIRPFRSRITTLPLSRTLIFRLMGAGSFWPAVKPRRWHIQAYRDTAGRGCQGRPPGRGALGLVLQDPLLADNVELHSDRLPTSGRSDNLRITQYDATSDHPAAETRKRKYSASARSWPPFAQLSQRDRKSTRLNSSHRCISYA